MGKLPILLKFYEESIKHFEDTPMASAFKSQYAWSLQHLAGQSQRARQLLEEVFRDTAYLLVSDLDRYIPTFSWAKRGYNFVVRLTARDDYSFLLYQEAAEEKTTEIRKNEILNKLSKLPPNDYPLAEWVRAGRPLAKDNSFIPRLLMKLGRRQEAKDLMEWGFLQCIELLSDDSGRKALLRLARILECAGLVERAREALSAIFSDVDPSEEVESEDEQRSSLDPSLKDLNIAGTNEDHDNEGEKETENFGHNESQETDISEGEHDGVYGSPFDEDLSYTQVNCHICNVAHYAWEVPFYFCLYCTDVRLCSTCFEDQRTTETSKKQLKKWEASVCDVANHQFLKGPVEGWGGVKDNVMTFGDRKIYWTNWLKQVQDEWRRGDWV
jgi:hypothetical protein